MTRDNGAAARSAARDQITRVIASNVADPDDTPAGIRATLRAIYSAAGSWPAAAAILARPGRDNRDSLRAALNRAYHKGRAPHWLRVRLGLAQVRQREAFESSPAIRARLQAQVKALDGSRSDWLALALDLVDIYLTRKYQAVGDDRVRPDHVRVGDPPPT